MRLQVAIDRVSVEAARQTIQKVQNHADIIEIGTSLIKDFGLANSVGALKREFFGQCILADIKTIDEGAYEFARAYEAGADIATVMGGASLATIEACRQVARDFGREYMIDLLEVPPEKAQALAAFEDAIFCLHLPSDLAGKGLQQLVEGRRESLQGVSRLAVAGGVQLQSLPFLKTAGVEIVIVGGAITKAQDVGAAAARFKACIKGDESDDGIVQ